MGSIGSGVAANNRAHMAPNASRLNVSGYLTRHRGVNSRTQRTAPCERQTYKESSVLKLDRFVTSMVGLAFARSNLRHANTQNKKMQARIHNNNNNTLTAIVALHDNHTHVHRRTPSSVPSCQAPVSPQSLPSPRLGTGLHQLGRRSVEGLHRRCNPSTQHGGACGLPLPGWARPAAHTGRCGTTWATLGTGGWHAGWQPCLGCRAESAPSGEVEAWCRGAKCPHTGQAGEGGG